jgi:hypothetical protein
MFMYTGFYIDYQFDCDEIVLSIFQVSIGIL